MMRLSMISLIYLVFLKEENIKAKGDNLSKEIKKIQLKSRLIYIKTFLNNIFFSDLHQ